LKWPPILLRSQTPTVQCEVMFGFFVLTILC
jgi:hypothetical protein